jgi:uncharacterized protein YcfJ
MSKLGLIELSFFVLAGFIVSSSFAQGNQTNMTTSATNETGGMMGNQINQTGGNQTQQGPFEQLGEKLGGIIGGGNQSQ